VKLLFGSLNVENCS